MLSRLQKITPVVGRQTRKLSATLPPWRKAPGAAAAPAAAKAEGKPAWMQGDGKAAAAPNAGGDLPPWRKGGSSSAAAGPAKAAKPAAAPAAAPASSGGGSPGSLPGNDLLKGFGDQSFKGAVADKYMAKVGLPTGTIEKGEWHKDIATADKVAEAVMHWATDMGCTVFCHWFQPLGAAGVRHGQSAMVQNAFFNFDMKTGQPKWNLKGSDLIQGETDGSSYPNGGLRATHTAGGYLTVDPTSPMWCRGDTVFVPACFVTYHGHSVDEKTPLLRSVDALTREGKRLLKLLGYDVPGLFSNIGLEQEFFLVPRDQYHRRPDLMMCGRTITGMDAARGQEMCDHYMGPPSLGSNPALACMQELQEECYKLGIPLKTRHREVAPGQYEFAPYFGFVTTQIDQNLLVMQILEEVATRHGLTALLHEKPFDGINGSGKHNNWSILTDDGINLFNVKQLEKASGSPDIFPVIMSAVVAAVDMHGDLLRMCISAPGNDFRLGACEAPPSIISTYLGDDLTDFLKDFKDGKSAAYSPKKFSKSVGASCLAELEIPAQDRNRTSPFPYGGHRFEFRAVGSSQNVSLVNTCLNAMCASMFKHFADAIASGMSPQEVSATALNYHWKAIFNGDNYDEANQKMLTDAGVWRIDSSVDAMCRMTDPKNIDLFQGMKIFSVEECAARQSTMLDHYVGTVEIEAKCMIQMLNQHVIPSVKRSGVGPSLGSLRMGVSTLENALQAMHHETDEKKKADLARNLRFETMEEVRKEVDAAEAVVPADLWTLATYQELLFLDQTS